MDRMLQCSSQNHLVMGQRSKNTCGPPHQRRHDEEVAMESSSVHPVREYASHAHLIPSHPHTYLSHTLHCTLHPLHQCGHDERVDNGNRVQQRTPGPGVRVTCKLSCLCALSGGEMDLCITWKPNSGVQDPMIQKFQGQLRG